MVFVLISGLFVAALFLPTAWNATLDPPVLGYEALHFAVTFGGVFWIPAGAVAAFAIGQIAYLRKLRKPAQSMAVAGLVLAFLGLPIMLYYDVAIALRLPRLGPVHRPRRHRHPG